MLISTCSRNGESGKLVRTYTGNTIQKEPSKVGIERYCSVPEFDKYEDRHRNSVTTAQRISQWISTEQLSVIYKEGKELEEILSEYCKFKNHNVSINTYQSIAIKRIDEDSCRVF